MFFWRVLTYHQPIVDLRTFGNRNFAFGTVFTFIAGIGMYGTTYLVPLFLAQVRGYSALQIGLTIIVVGMVTMVMSPASTRIARLLDLRVMLAIGFGLFALSMYLNATLTNQTGFWELFVPQVVRGLGLICIYMPANMIALGTLPQDRMRNAAGLYNLTRDLGGAIGLATIVTTMNDRLHFHWNRLIEHLNPARPVVQHFLDLQTSRFEPLISGDPGDRLGQNAGQAGAARSACVDVQRPSAADRRGVCLRTDATAAGPSDALILLALSWRGSAWPLPPSRCAQPLARALSHGQLVMVRRSAFGARPSRAGPSANVS